MATDPDREALRLQARRHVERVHALKRHVVVYVVVVILITAGWAVVEASDGSWSFWVVWPLLVWTQILLVHALVTYLRRPVAQSEIDRELERLERDR